MNKYFNKNTNKNTTQTNVNSEGVRMFKAKRLSKYVLPKIDEVPADDYYSVITCANEVETRFGKNAIEVYYKIYKASLCHRGVNGLLPEGTTIAPYYVKQVYIEDSPRYERFLDAMDDALNKKSEPFALSELTNVSEYISLGYDGSDIGGFVRRKPYYIDDFYKPELHSNEADVCEESEEAFESAKNADEVAEDDKAQDGCDDFDDFDDFDDDDDDYLD